MANITSITQDWEGHSGLEVQDFIKGLISGMSSDISSLRHDSVAKIDVKNPIDPVTLLEDKTKLIITGYNKDNEQVTQKEFTTVTEGKYSLKFIIPEDGSYDSVINGKNDFLILYNYYLEDKDGNKLTGKIGDIRCIIKNNGTQKIHLLKTYASTTKTNKPGYIIIPKELFGSGLHEISILAVTNISDSSYVESLPITIFTYVADMNLTCSVQTGTYFGPRGANESFTLITEVKDGKGNIINEYIPKEGEPITFEIKKNYYVGLYNDLYKITKLSGTTAQSKTTSFADIYKSGATPSNLNEDSIYSEPSVRLFVEAYIKIEGYDDPIKSNVVMLEMLNSSYTGNLLQVASRFSDIYMNGSQVNIYAKQYTSIHFEFATRCQNADQSYDIFCTNNSTGDKTKISQDTTSSGDLYKIVPFDYIFKNSGNYSINIGNGYSINVTVQAIAANFKDPEGRTLNLQSSTKAANAKDTTWGEDLVVFDGFDWISNGWVSTKDKQGTVNAGTALLLNNGANISIDYQPYKTSLYPSTATTYPYTISVRYKISNGVDPNEDLISCISGDTGFYIKPQKVGIKTTTETSLSIDNSDIHEVTFVYYGTSDTASIYKGLQAIYIDGVIQSVSEAGTFGSHNTKITAQANTASLYIYSIQAYRRALSFSEIQSVYCLNKNDINFIADYVNKNNIFNVSDTSIIGDYGLNVKSANVPDGSACMILYSGEYDPRPWETINSYSMDSAEANKRKRHYLSAVRLFIKGESANPRNFYAVNATLGALGTSSMNYLIKNYRLYFNKNASSSGVSEYDDKMGKTTLFYLGSAADPLPADFNPETATEDLKSNYLDSDNEYSIYHTKYGDSYDSAHVNRLCLKANYAESSGVHNGGFARLANEAFKQNSTKLAATGITSKNESCLTPPLYAVSSANRDNWLPEEGEKTHWRFDVRTNIDSRPIYLFFHDTTTGIEYYAGRYNMNNDKANYKVFGFEKVRDYFENQIVKEEGAIIRDRASGVADKFGYTFLDSNNNAIDPNYDKTHEYIDSANGIINPVECWEFSSNTSEATEIGSFHGYTAFQAFSTKTSQKDPVDAQYDGLRWINQVWEYRFPNLDAGDPGDLCYRSGLSRPYLLYKTYEFLQKHNIDSTRNTLNNLNSFADNLHYYFNVNSVVKYFVLTHWFAAVDLRIKNAMLAFYCDPYGVSEEEANSVNSPLHYMRGYFIFYDNDTILGLNNTGAIQIPWDFYETDTGNESRTGLNYTAFPGNGKSGLWTVLLLCYQAYIDKTISAANSAYTLGSMIAQAYLYLRDYLTDEKIDEFLEGMCDYYPDSVHNVDLEVKYLNPNNLRTAYSTDMVLGQVEIPVHLDMAQGTRKYHRKYWLKKRSLWLDDLYESGSSEKYNISYKTNSTAGSDKGIIKLTVADEFRNWRFYGWCASGGNKSISVQTPLTKYGLIAQLSVSGSGSLKLSTSDAFFISDLYGCKSIDFSDWTFDTLTGLGLCLVLGEFPYMQEIVINRFNSGKTIKSNTKDGVLDWLSPTAMPNLKRIEICNVQPINEGALTQYFGKINLSNNGNEFQHLETLDTRNTPISEIILPNSNSLKNLYLYKPTKLSIYNKTNLLMFEITDTSALELYSVKSSGSLAYLKVLEYALSSFGLKENDIEIQFGSSATNRYQINNSNKSQFDILNLLATLVKTDQNPGGTDLIISGYIFNNCGYDTEDITEVFTNLNISKVSSTGVPTFEWNKDLYEDANNFNDLNGEYSSYNCLIVSASVDVDKESWRIEVDGNPNNDLDGKIRIVKTSSSKCYIHADPNGLNDRVDNRDHVIKVYATVGDKEYSTLENINIYYKPITSLSLSSKDVYTTTSTTIQMQFNENHTKKYLLHRSVIEADSSKYSIEATNGATCSLIYDADGYLSGALVSLRDDTIVEATILGIKSAIQIYYNTTFIEDLSSLNDKNNPLYWVYVLFSKGGKDLGTVIKNSVNKKQASSITITDAMWNAIVGELYESQPQDFTYLKYFQLGNPLKKFVIPSIRFSKLETPIGTLMVLWPEASNSPSDYDTIIFGSTVRKASVSCNFSLQVDSSKLKFDLSRTNIQYIYAAGSDIDRLSDYIFSLQITLSMSASTTMRVDPLFVYPKTLKQIGNTNITIQPNSQFAFGTSLMFNGTSNDSPISILNTNPYAPIFSLSGLDTVENSITLGAISSYPLSDPCLTSTDMMKVGLISNAFIYLNGTPLTEGTNLDLRLIKDVGYGALYCDSGTLINENYNGKRPSKVLLSDNLLKIGDYAFNYGLFEIQNANAPYGDSDGVANFNELKEIGNYSFYIFDRALNIRFDNIEKIGTWAFVSSIDGPSINIFMNKTTAFPAGKLDQYAFGGSDNSDNIHIYVPLGALYDLLRSLPCKERVHLKTF